MYYAVFDLSTTLETSQLTLNQLGTPLRCLQESSIAFPRFSTCICLPIAFLGALNEMSPHNKRAMAHRVAAKERIAARYGRGRRKKEVRHSRGRPNHSNKERGNSYTSIYNEPNPLDRQIFDFLIVVDVEATCERKNDNYPHEIIELPGVLVDVRRGVIDKGRSFRSYVRPIINPILTDFCKSLTGITQENVDGAPVLQDVVKLFEEWYRRTIPAGAKVVFATDGPWDLKNFVYEHSIMRDHVRFPSIFYEYVDIRTTFANYFNKGKLIKLEDMLHRMNLQFEGRPHSGFDDSVNIARLALSMMKAGCVFNYLVSIPLTDKFYYSLEGVPLYRREEGSGTLDPDVVNDIAKKCYGDEYFSFGTRHRDEVLKYRKQQQLLEHNNKPRASLKPPPLRHGGQGIRYRLVAVLVLLAVAVMMLLALAYRKMLSWYNKPH
ncbi:hypothetical protein TRVL_05853 [Trypanosoma vivax]|nr:hypothetical protein TRVL_05853 [Trypanosoma vivax]